MHVHFFNERWDGTVLEYVAAFPQMFEVWAFKHSHLSSVFVSSSVVFP